MILKYYPPNEKARHARLEREAVAAGLDPKKDPTTVILKRVRSLDETWMAQKREAEEKTRDAWERRLEIADDAAARWAKTFEWSRRNDAMAFGGLRVIREALTIDPNATLDVESLGTVRLSLGTEDLINLQTAGDGANVGQINRRGIVEAKSLPRETQGRLVDALLAFARRFREDRQAKLDAEQKEKPPLPASGMLALSAVALAARAGALVEAQKKEAARIAAERREVAVQKTLSEWNTPAAKAARAERIAKLNAQGIASTGPKRGRKPAQGPGRRAL